MSHGAEGCVRASNRLAPKKHMSEPKQTTRGGLVDSIKAVLWSFLGVRRGRDREQDFANLRPVPVLIAALLCVVIFVGVLIAVVLTVVP